MPAGNTGFASGGVTCKLGALCFYSSLVLIDSFVLRNPPERKARKRCAAYKESPRANRHIWFLPTRNANAEKPKEPVLLPTLGQKR
ncbi:hypothetical protein Aoki45_24170 [Algoriphagus sp. oki45]|nr:hypothetical protein Aoki45_24170 [Algoriphagus sp. oki45]